MALFMGIGNLACSDQTLPEPRNRNSKYVDGNVIPTPKSFLGNQQNGKYKAFEYDAVFCCEVEAWRPAVQAFQQYAVKIHDLPLSEGDGGLVLRQDESLPDGAYRLRAGNKIELLASDVTGIQLGLSTLLQLISKSDHGMYVPLVEIEDQGDCEWRGFFVDLARAWHDPQMLFDYVDLCYFYKINILVLHTSDDQSYTLPCSSYPELSTAGRTYSRETIDQLVEYASARGVILVPGVDTPGHCTQFNKKYPRIFGLNGIICQHEDSFAALDEIYTEICQMFPNSPYIFIGGDEAALMNWSKCSKCMGYAKAQGLYVEGDAEKTVQNMYAHFIDRLSKVILRNGRTPIVSEGFPAAANHLVTKEIIVLSWENYYQTTPDLLDGGFRIVNASWSPLYIVPPGTGWKPEELFAWDIYTWKPIHNQSIYYPDGFKMEPNDQVLGGLLHTFGDVLSSYEPGEELEQGLEIEVNMVRERLPAFAEKNWNITSPITWEVFEARSQKVKILEEKLLEK